MRHLPTPLELLEHIAAHPGRTQADLAADLGVEARRLVHRVSVLEELYLIDRPRRPDGTRPLCPSPAAEAFLATLAIKER